MFATPVLGQTTFKEYGFEGVPNHWPISGQPLIVCFVFNNASYSGYRGYEKLSLHCVFFYNKKV